MDNPRKTNPKIKSNILSYITFFYTLSLFKKGFKKELEENDIYEVIPKLKSEKLGKIAEQKWNSEKQKQNPSIVRFLLKCFWKEYVVISIFQIFVIILISSIQPIAVGKFVSYFQRNQQKISFKQVSLFGLVIIILNFVNCLATYNIRMLIVELAIKLRTTCGLLIYQKLFNINQTTSSNMKIGQIVTMLTKDLFMISRAFEFCNIFFIGFVKVFVLIFWIYKKMGSSAWIACGCFLVYFLIEGYLASQVFHYRTKSYKKTEERVLLEQETLTALNVIKSNVWEKFFLDKLIAIRSSEIKLIKALVLFKTSFFATGYTTFHFSIFFIIMYYLWTSNHLSAEIVFFVISCYQPLKLWLTKDTSMGIFYIASVVSSTKRISDFLLLEEIEKSSILKSEKHGNLGITFANVSVENDNKVVLEDISFKVNSGLFVITGPIGSGKTLLLKVILDEVKLCKGSVEVIGSISYASQKPWLFPLSIKQNIIFGQLFDEKRYKEILRICCLEQDLNEMDDRDETIIIDHGNNLSEGQKARINLARALYKESDIYLIDDSMAGLDSIVSNSIYKNCIHNFLKGKICILVTQNLNNIKEESKIFNLQNNEIIFKEKIIDSVENSPGINANEKVVNQSYEIPEETDTLLPSSFGKDIYTEEKKVGKVNWSVYKRYIQFSGGTFWLGFIFIWFILFQFAESAIIKIIGSWINCREEYYKQKNNTNLVVSENLENKMNTLSYLYICCLVGVPIFASLRILFFFNAVFQASKNIYRSMVTSVLHCYIEFMNRNFLGNIINRFSKDVFTVDEIVSVTFYTVLINVMHIIGAVIIISMTRAYFLILLLLFFMILLVISLLYLPSGRSLKRIEASTLGPIISYMSSTLEGLTTIKVNGAESILKRDFNKYQNQYTSVFHMLENAQTAYLFFLEITSNLLVILIIIYFLFINPEVSSGIVGVTLNQTLFLTRLLGGGFKACITLEQYFTSLERILEYVDIEEENSKGVALETWPKTGTIRFDNVSLRYNSCQQYSLKQLKITINAGEKICIIGRTGAGKTSMVMALLRLHAIEGNIFIDDLNIDDVSLNHLRKSITFITQDPILFTGTIRSNIDPTNEYSDSEIWEALLRVKLNRNIHSLDQKTLYYDTTLSAGHKQLLCLARALLNRNKIVILDEPTSNLDLDFETILQDCINSYFEDCTVIIITHRLGLINWFDKVLVIENGSLLENDVPDILIRNKNSKCFYMVEQARM